MNTELAWAAGFFDGEGCTYVVNNSPNSNQIVMKVSQEHREPLERFLSAVGIGNIRGPYKKKNHNSSTYYTWQIGSRDGVQEVSASLQPYLCSIKRDQIQRSWILYYSKPHLGVGAPGRKRPRKKKDA